MRQSDYYKLDLVEGEDIVNPLVQDVPNYEKIDKALHDNYSRGIGKAEELKVGTVHNITRENKDLNIFVLQAISDFKTGDTFTVDENKVTAYLPNGNALTTGAFKTNSQLICVLYLNALYICTTNDYSNLQTEINDILKSIETINDNLKTKENKDKHIVVIGDSYGVGTVVQATPYTTLLKNILNMDDNHYYTMSKNGAGFINGQLLENLKNLNIKDKDSIDEIYVFGGWNDGSDRGNVSLLETGLTTFSSYVHANFKNAKLYLGFLAYGNTTATILQYLKQSYSYYKNCAMYGFDGFVENSESICADRNPDYWGNGNDTNFRHPTQIMQQRIANYIAQFIKTKTLSIYNEYNCTLKPISSNVTFDLTNLLKQVVVNNLVTTTLRGQTVITFTNNVQFPQSQYTNIATIEDNAIVGSSGYIRGTMYVNYENANGDYRTLPMTWRIQNNVFSLFNGHDNMNVAKMYLNGDTCTVDVINN